MKTQKLLLLVCLVLFPLSALAQGHSQTYIIEKGDTLWGISERFIKDPYYWPNLWANNPFVTNPHLVYPGQTLAIYDGRIEIVPAQPPLMQPAAPAPVPPEPRQTITVKSVGGTEGFISLDELSSSGTLIDTVDNRILMAEGDRVFLDMKDLSSINPGDKFSLVKVGEKVRHPITGKPVGHQVVDLGSLQIIEVSSATATAIITSSHGEIQRGARLLPYLPPLQEIALKKSKQVLSGSLVADRDNKSALSLYDVIYVDLGSQDGLEAGNLLYISRPRKASELALQGQNIPLPDMLLGSAVVLKTHKHTASALVLKAVDPLYLGDKVFTTIE
jgi:hypothetical protein